MKAEDYRRLKGLGQLVVFDHEIGEQSIYDIQGRCYLFHDKTEEVFDLGFSDNFLEELVSDLRSILSKLKIDPSPFTDEEIIISMGLMSESPVIKKFPEPFTMNSDWDFTKLGRYYLSAWYLPFKIAKIDG
jgi:hypothetical protein